MNVLYQEPLNFIQTIHIFALFLINVVDLLSIRVRDLIALNDDDTSVRVPLFSFFSCIISTLLYIYIIISASEAMQLRAPKLYHSFVYIYFKMCFTMYISICYHMYLNYFKLTAKLPSIVICSFKFKGDSSN